VIAVGQFLEVLIGGLMSGVLYSLVALGFVLIFKASGVFNFAQGAMVLLAGLALVRSLDFLVAKGFPIWAAIIIGIGMSIIAARVLYSLGVDRRYAHLLEEEVANQTRSLMSSLGATASAERNLRLLMEAVPDAITVLDREGRSGLSDRLAKSGQSGAAIVV